jgi:putative Mg2+ transporter-C (MgtC) family protein
MSPQSYAYHFIRFDRTEAKSEEEIRALLAEYGFSMANIGYRITHDGPCFEYRVTIQTTDPND